MFPHAHWASCQCHTFNRDNVIIRDTKSNFTKNITKMDVMRTTTPSLSGTFLNVDLFSIRRRTLILFGTSSWTYVYLKCSSLLHLHTYARLLSASAHIILALAISCHYLTAKCAWRNKSFRNVLEDYQNGSPSAYFQLSDDNEHNK